MLHVLTHSCPTRRSSGLLTFRRKTYGNPDSLSAYTKGPNGFPLHYDINLGYDLDRVFGKACLWLADENANNNPPLFFFEVAEGTDPAELAHRMSAIRFTVEMHFGVQWVVSSTGHAVALDQAGELTEARKSVV